MNNDPQPPPPPPNTPHYNTPTASPSRLNLALLNSALNNLGNYQNSAPGPSGNAPPSSGDNQASSASNSQGQGNKQPESGSNNNENKKATVGLLDSIEAVISLQREAWKFQHELTYEQNHQSLFQHHIQQAFPNLALQLGVCHPNLKRDFASLSNVQMDYMGAMIQEQQRLMQNAMAERDRACTERDQVIRDVTRLREVNQRQDQQMKDLQNKFTSEIEQLQQQIRFLTDQVEGKRAIWFEYNPKSTAKSSRARDPYSTPPDLATPTKSKNVTSTQGGVPPSFDLIKRLNEMDISPAPSMESNYGSTMPSGPAQPAGHFLPYSGHRIVTSINGSTEYSVAPLPTTSLVPFKSNEQLVEEFVDSFDRVYCMIFGWVNTYADKLNPLETDRVIEQNYLLWKFILSCVTPYASKQAYNHVTRLLRDASTRSWFVMRMAVEYIRNRIWHHSAWLGSSDAASRELSRIADRLAVKGLPSEERALLVTSRTVIVQDIVDGDGYTAFRAAMVSQHAKKLRDCLGPVLNADAKRADAGRDLTAIATKAFDLSARLYTSGWTFLISMPDTGSKFLHPNMKPRNTTQSPLEMHIRQTRVKFAITPFITMRDDRGMSIVTRNIDQASVLVEE